MRCSIISGVREAEAASGIGAFVLDVSNQDWAWSPPVAGLFGFSAENAPGSFGEWLRAVFVDDVPKIRRAIDLARDGTSFYVEFRVKTDSGPLHWLAGKGQTSDVGDDRRLLRGTFYDI